MKTFWRQGTILSVNPTANEDRAMTVEFSEAHEGGTGERGVGIEIGMGKGSARPRLSPACDCCSNIQLSGCSVRVLVDALQCDHAMISAAIRFLRTIIPNKGTVQNWEPRTGPDRLLLCFAFHFQVHVECRHLSERLSASGIPCCRADSACTWRTTTAKLPCMTSGSRSHDSR